MNIKMPIVAFDMTHLSNYNNNSVLLVSSQECQAECFERLVPARCGCSIYVDDFPDQYEMYYPEEEEEIEEEPSSEEDNGIKACDAKTGSD